MLQDDHQILSLVIRAVRLSNPGESRKWFDELDALGLAGGAFGVRAETDMHRDYLRRSCLEAFNGALAEITGQLLAVRFLGPNDEWEHGPEPKGGTEQRAVAHSGHARSELVRLQSEHALPINPDYGFKDFVIGPNNQLAHAACLAVSENPGRSYNPLFIHGGVGLGKTHLLHAVCLKILSTQPEIRVHYVSCDGFMTQFMNAVQSGKMAEFRHTFRDVDLLVIDDIHFLAGRDRTQEEFFHTFNALYQANKQIILSSDTPPEEIPDLEERLVSRFVWGVVADVKKPGFETRVEILKRKADARSIKLPEPVAIEIANHIDTNIRELEGAITKLQVVSQIRGEDIDLDLAREALGEEFAAALSAQENGPSIDRIISEIIAYYSIKRADLLGKRRHKSIALPRQIGMYLARQTTRHSLEEIGAHFGGRDHTTVMHAVRTVGEKIESIETVANDVRAIESRLRVGAGV